MGLRDIETNLPPGFRFFPSDEELVCHYLSKKVANERISHGTLVEVDLHTREPWDLPDVAKLSMNEWYFFSFRDRKYATGSRTNRATKCGYWKATGKDRIVNDPKTKAIVGMRKTLVFYRGRAPNGIKSDWVMHEFRLENPNTPAKEDWVLCRVFHKRKRETVRSVDGTASSAGNGCFFSVSTSASATAVDDECLGSSPPPPPLGVIEGEPMMPDGNCCEPMQHMGSLSSFPHMHVPHQEDTSSNTFLNLAVLHHNFLDFPQAQQEEHQLQLGHTHTHMMAMGMGSSLGDDCGFFFDDIGQDPDVIASLGLEQDIYKA